MRKNISTELLLSAALAVSPVVLSGCSTPASREKNLLMIAEIADSAVQSADILTKTGSSKIMRLRSLYRTNPECQSLFQNSQLEVRVSMINGYLVADVNLTFGGQKYEVSFGTVNQVFEPKSLPVITEHFQKEIEEWIRTTIMNRVGMLFPQCANSSDNASYNVPVGDAFRQRYIVYERLNNNQCQPTTYTIGKNLKTQPQRIAQPYITDVNRRGKFMFPTARSNTSS